MDDAIRSGARGWNRREHYRPSQVYNRMHIALYKQPEMATIPMPAKCPRCGSDAIPGKHFCPDCGALLALGISGASIDSYIRDRISEQIDGSFKDKRLVELETTQAIATRLIDWAKVFAFAAGIPVALLALILGLMGYNSIQDARKLTSEASERIRPVVDDALTKAREAQTLSTSTLTRVTQMRESLKTAEAAVQDQKLKVARETEQMNAQLSKATGMKNQLAGLAAQLHQRADEAAKLQRTVSDLSKRVEASEVANVFPDLGSKPVPTINGAALGTKSPNQLWLDLQLSFLAERNTRLTADQINDVRLALQKEGMIVFLGYPGVTRNRGTSMAMQPGGSEERSQILYFKAQGAAPAQLIKKVLAKWLSVQDSMVRFADPSKLDETTQEFLRLSEVDFMVVIGTR